jgi:hypothetical protein
MIIEKGVIFSISKNSGEQEKYIVVERIEDIGRGEGGWICFNWNAVLEKGSENISAFDCWRVTDRYLEIQIQRGLIKLVETI